jgi:hypothetical protein
MAMPFATSADTSLPEAALLLLVAFITILNRLLALPAMIHFRTGNSVFVPWIFEGLLLQVQSAWNGRQ